MGWKDKFMGRLDIICTKVNDILTMIRTNHGDFDKLHSKIDKIYECVANNAVRFREHKMSHISIHDKQDALVRTIGNQFDAFNEKIDKVIPRKCENKNCLSHVTGGVFELPFVEIDNDGINITVCQHCLRTIYNRRK